MKKGLLIGTSDFKRYIDGNGYFVDKSLFIKQVLDNKSTVQLITRPRRFGKTLNMTMLRYFFEDGKEDNSYLFKDLEVSKHSDIMKYQGKYPVIYLTFKDIKFSDWDTCFEALKEEMRKVYYKFKDILDLNEISEFEKKIFNKILCEEGSLKETINSLKNICEYIFKATGKQIIVLIDEYDTPIHSAYFNGYYDKIIEFMRGFLGGALKDNVYLEKAVITGILRVSKESIFSGLNNITSNTIIDYNFQDCFGFTEKEVENLLKYYDLEYDINEVKSWYNGYIFGKTVIYNPWSIINYTANHGRGLMAHWVGTSDNAIIDELISKGDKSVKISLEELMNGNGITKRIKEDVNLRDIEGNPENVWSFLLFNGYLKAISKSYDENGLLCELKIPNKEVKYLYNDIILKWGSKVITTSDFELMLKYLVTGDIDSFSDYFKEYVLNSMSYFDVAGEESEKVYHAFVLGMLVALSKDYKVKSNRESGLGRYDVMIIPKDKNKNGIIIEFKKFNSSREETIEEAAENAINQIKNKNYKQELLDEGIKNIIEIGIAFKGKEVRVVSFNLFSDA